MTPAQGIKNTLVCDTAALLLFSSLRTVSMGKGTHLLLLFLVAYCFGGERRERCVPPEPPTQQCVVWRQVSLRLALRRPLDFNDYLHYVHHAGLETHALR